MVGLGKLGAPLATVFADSGLSVLGIDRSISVVSKIRRGEAPVDETGLSELMALNPFDASTSFEGVADCEATFIIVPTPSEPGGAFSNTYVLDAVRSIGEALRERDGWHVVVVCSTVMPGSMQNVIRPALEEASGRTDVGLCYSPEFIALGSVIEDIRNPDMVLIGASDGASGIFLAKLLVDVVDNHPPVLHMSLVNAELAKISVNAYLTMKMSFANNLGELCERIPGGDAAVVAEAIGMDGRIGLRYLQPALAYGGPCFPRDTRAFSALALEVGASADLASASQRINIRQYNRLFEKVVALLGPGDSVAVLGLTYKPNTTVVEESAGTALVEQLTLKGIPVTAYDPAVPRASAPSMAAATEGARVVVVTTPWREFDTFVPERRQIVLDCWGLLPDGPNVLRVGQG